MAKYRVTVDTGGTFSDFVFFNEDTGEITITKVPSTPREPFQAVLNGVKELLDDGVDARDISFFCHGTTVGTNALLDGFHVHVVSGDPVSGEGNVFERNRATITATDGYAFRIPSGAAGNVVRCDNQATPAARTAAVSRRFTTARRAVARTGGASPARPRCHPCRDTPTHRATHPGATSGAA